MVRAGVASRSNVSMGAGECHKLYRLAIIGMEGWRQYARGPNDAEP